MNQMMTARAAQWVLRSRTIDVRRPVVLGILNVTPDSFSDGGQFRSTQAAVARGVTMLDEGADIVDVGGESTRPQGAVVVSVEEELSRVIPVIEGIREVRPDAILSVDTTKSAVAAAALDAGAVIVNDVSGFRLDPQMGEICAARDAGVILMHSRGGVHDMATFAHAEYEDVVTEVMNELRRRIEEAKMAGVAADRIVVDPGIGFSKRGEQSLAVMAALPRIAELGHAVLVGASRKRFIGEITGVREASQRVAGSVGAHVAALALGARLFRVHDVRETRQALDVAWAVLGRSMLA